jgi:perosamine synthetase
LIARLHDVLATGNYTNDKYCLAFESAFKEEFDLQGQCIAVNGCQSGLMLVLKALGVYYALVPDFTFSATANAVYWACHGMKVGDCDPRTFNLEPKLPSDVDTIVATHVFGGPCECDALQELADKDSLPLIFDCAHALGAKFKGKPIGDFGTASVFSFSPSKQITCSEGGMIVTKDAYLAERLRILKSYGTEDGYDQAIPGLNARMSEVHACFGLESLSTFAERQKHRLSLVEEYKTHFSEDMMQQTTSESFHAYKDFALLLGDKREKVEIELTKKQIPFKRYFKPISSLSSYKGWLIPQKNALRISESILQLPLHSNLEIEDCRRIANVVSSVLTGDTFEGSKVAVDSIASTAQPIDCRNVANGRLV